MEDDQQFCLRWNNHQNTLISNFDKLLENGTLVDCTLAAEGQFLKAHKVVLSACSPYFANLLKEQYDKHPIFILKDVKYQELRAMMDYMYRGEVNISQDQLAALLKAAESLQIKGLSDRPQRSTDQHQNINVPGRMQHPHGGYTLEQAKRPRLGPVIDTPDMREGSSSPTSRKRKKLRRRSIENVLDNHEHSNSSAHSTQPINTSTPSITSGTAAAIVATSQQQQQQQQQQSQQSLQQSSVSQQQQQQGNIVGTKKTENVSNIKQTAGSSDDVILAEQDNQMEQDKSIKKDQIKQQQQQQQQQHQRKSGHDKDELLIEPKNEYEEVNEPIEDLTEDPEELMDDEDLDNQAGPSHHGGEGSSQGFPQWPADRSQDEFIMTAQDQGQQRDPQDLRTNVKTESPSPSPKFILSSTQDSSTPNIVRNDAHIANMRQQQTSPLPLTNGNKQQQQQQQQKQQQQHNHQRSVSEESGKSGGASMPHQLSMSDVSDMLLEFYKVNAAKVPKNNKIDKFPRQTSPSSADGATSIITSTPTITITPTKIRPPSSSNNNNETISSTSIHASTIIENLTAAAAVVSKNLNGDEMVAKKSINESQQHYQSQQQSQSIEENCNTSSSSSSVVNVVTKDFSKKLNAPFHPRIKYSSVNNKSPAAGQLATIIQPLIGENVPQTSTTTVAAVAVNAITTPSSANLPQSSVVVMPSSVIQPPILPTAPAAAALAAALFRDGYQNFHHQIRAQEQLLKQRQQQEPNQQQQQQQQSVGSSNGLLKNDRNCGSNNGANSIRIEERRLSGPPQFPPKYMQNFLMKKDQYSDNDQSSSDEREDDDEDEGKYPEIDDIHLIEGSKSGFNTSNQLSVSMDATDYITDEAHHKYSMIAAHALRNLEYYNSGGNGNNNMSGADNMSANGSSDGGNNSILSKYEVGPNGEVEAMYNCRHCGKKYRWKSTLRRHENVECGGKEPSHQCPYCPYKSKQRGNLGVHVRKHHANLPQLASKRRSKYSQPRD